jgi:hypothetical protein
MTWDDLNEDGRFNFYEGDEPEAFAAEMLAEFGIDVHKTDRYGSDTWEELIEDGDGGTHPARYFFIPERLRKAVYLSGRWRLGS